ncbi:efflux RND transporter permease subunit [Oceanobacillus alkalisoli]|uniref:efflux RND transporter permease subunit n=1 Tax=Oceanobacillus alkalisoli TaxID=2925113 RepID=UPI001F11D969|nr:efflux RND transporter permease subunit [Oceanobacillus alkalisoli]MCF3943597.1 efflux RND transporter permease subunit [Oceanobacillus alkalisoli]
MKSIANFVMKNKLAVWLLTIIVTASGIYAGTQMKTESIPDISIPYLMVMDVYPGATAEQVMEDISIPLERTVEDLEDVKNIYSDSSSSLSSIQIEYEYGVDIAEKRRELQDAIEGVNLPEDAGEPTITAISLDMMPIVALSISSTEEDIIDLTSTVDEVILPKIEKLDGVASATMAGHHVEEVQLTFDEAYMEELELDEETVRDMIQASDMAVSLGLYEFTEGEEAVAVDGKFMTAEELEEMVIPVTPTEENPVPFVELADIAEIETVGKVESVSRTNGEDAIGIQIVKGQQANTVDVVNAVKDLMKKEQDRLDGLVVDISLDQGEPIEDSVSTMVEKALFGGLIAVMIILLFLRDIKSTIISIISIPVSIFTAFLILNWLDITMNIMTLGAVTVAIGRVIDDSIVVVENIYRRLHLKDEPLRGRALIREATIEMFKPILSSTLVTIAVFAPMVFIGGMVGELFMPFALTMSLALLASLVVAITIVPALSHTLFKKKLYGDRTEVKHKEQGKITQGYKRFLNWTLNHKIITSVIAIALLVGSLFLTPLIGFSFLGSDEEKVMYITYSPEPGELMDDTLQNVAEVEDKLIARDDTEIVQLSINDSTSPEAAMMGGGGGGALIFVTFDDDMENFPDVRDEIKHYITEIGHSGEWISQDFASMDMSSNELSYTFYSEDLNDLNEAVEMVEDVMTENERLEDVSSTAEGAYVEHVLQVDQADLLQYGLTTGQIVGMLSTSSTEDVLTTVEKDGDTLDVIVQQEAETDATSIDELLELEVPVPAQPGTVLPLSELVSVEEDSTVATLSRSNNQYYATVTGTILDQDISHATSEVDEAIEDLELPRGVEVDIAGVAADMEETFEQLGVAMLAAIAIVYFILVVTFSEGIAPFAVLFSLPFAVIGSFVGLYLTGETISVTVMMGLLMLIGIIVTNAIVLVDRIIRMERSGMSLREAIIEGGGTRLRPILMTAIATIGALIPLAVTGGGGLVSRDLGITVIGGLASSTLLTLIIVPLVYEFLSKLFKKDRKNIRED